MKYLVLKERKTHQEISDMLKERNPGIKGLSTMSIRNFCVNNGIRTRRTPEEIEAEKRVSTQVTF